MEMVMKIEHNSPLRVIFLSRPVCSIPLVPSHDNPIHQKIDLNQHLFSKSQKLTVGIIKHVKGINYVNHSDLLFNLKLNKNVKEKYIIESNFLTLET